jgi:hypothetical protein
MKIAAIVFALVSSATAVAVAEECDATSLTALAATTEYAQCETDSGYTLTSLTAPDNTTAQIMCTSTACLTLLDRIDALNFGDCTIGNLTIMTDIVAPIDVVCAGSGSESAAGDSKFTISRHRCRVRCF